MIKKQITIILLVLFGISCVFLSGCDKVAADVLMVPKEYYLTSALSHDLVIELCVKEKSYLRNIETIKYQTKHDGTYLATDYELSGEGRLRYFSEYYYSFLITIKSAKQISSTSGNLLSIVGEEFSFEIEVGSIHVRETSWSEIEEKIVFIKALSGIKGGIRLKEIYIEGEFLESRINRVDVGTYKDVVFNVTPDKLIVEVPFAPLMLDQTYLVLYQDNEYQVVDTFRYFHMLLAYEELQTLSFAKVH